MTVYRMPAGITEWPIQQPNTYHALMFFTHCHQHTRAVYRMPAGITEWPKKHHKHAPCTVGRSMSVSLHCRPHTRAVYRMPAGITGWPLHCQSTHDQQHTHAVYRMPAGITGWPLALTAATHTVNNTTRAVYRMPARITGWPLTRTLSASPTVNHMSTTQHVPFTGCPQGSRDGQLHTHMPQLTCRSSRLLMHTAPAHQAASARRRLAQTRESKAAVSSCM